MQLLTPIINRLTDDTTIKQKINHMTSDGEIYDYLSKSVDSKEILVAFEHYYGVEFIDLSTITIGEGILSQFDIEMLQKRHVLPYAYNEEKNTYFFALHDVFNESLRKAISASCREISARAEFQFAPKEHIDEKYNHLKSEPIKTTQTPLEIEEENQSVEIIDEGGFNARDWLDDVLNKAIQINASDIHIEPLKDALQVRYRVDGVMTRKKVYNYSDGVISTIFVRLKVISGMDISEKRKAQDGRIDNYQHAEYTFDLRVSTVSTVYGEKAVLRLLDKSSKILTFEQLGFSEKDTTSIRKMLANNNGIIYIAGATGSGKTTTLYSMINELNDDSVNFYSIENPVEKTIENVNQIQIDEASGITFPSTLRALLRQDPDIIVVGEIRDQETAELSVRSSLTGHLVLSTLHANSALDSIGRLMNMGIEPYLIVGSSLGFTSQRLVRKLCDHCKRPKQALTASEEAWLTQKEHENNIKVDRNQFHEAVGCEHCTEGYRGRIATVEIVKLSEPLKALILKNASTAELKEQALIDGFKPMVVDGLDKVRSGLTSINELIRELN